MDDKKGDARCGDLVCGKLKTCRSIGTISQDGTTVGVDDGTPCELDHATKYSSKDTSSQPQCKAGKCVPSRELAPITVCGNGVTEQGEECDCGQANDPCCQCTTCKFKPGAKCSNCSPCCNQCQVIKSSENKICRDKKFPCDKAEICDGTSGICPADVQAPSPSECTDSNGLSGSCQVDGSCTTVGSVCAQQWGAEYGECLASEADGKVDVCGSLMCVKRNAGAAGQCFKSGSTVPADATAGLPCTSPAGGSFGVCNFVKECKAPTSFAPQTARPSLVVCAGIGSYGTIDPEVEKAAAIAAIIANGGMVPGMGGNNSTNDAPEPLPEEVVLGLIIAGVVVGCLLLFYFLWWYMEWVSFDCVCTFEFVFLVWLVWVGWVGWVSLVYLINWLLGCTKRRCLLLFYLLLQECPSCRCKNPCKGCCESISEKCSGCCRRSPEAVAAAAARKHEKNKSKQSKKKHRESEKRRKEALKKEKKDAKKAKKKKGGAEIELGSLEEGKLKPGWEQAEDASGNIFYWNADLEESTWVKPTISSSSKPTHRATDTLMPSGWDAEMSEEYGQKFYTNPNGDSQWDRPPGNE